MQIQALTTFPVMYDSVMGESMMKRAQVGGYIDFKAFDLREWTHDRHRTTDDYPYGGGSGLLMKCEPIFEALEDIMPEALDFGSVPKGTHVVFLSPLGRTFDDAYATELSHASKIMFVCGHYEGMDERVYTLATDLISLGDYVLTSGELASMVVIDALVRKIPGVLGAENGAEDESFANGLLEYPQYTRPAQYRGMSVPEVLLSGHHENINKWRRTKSLERTYYLRPDLIDAARAADALSENELIYLDSLPKREE